MITQVKSHYAKKLETIRKSAGYRQKEVAAAIGEKPSTYAAWEEGRAQPHLHQIDKLHKWYGEWFIEKLFQ
jgi:transcriptional regulator with XRE-family HTH domain